LPPNSIIDLREVVTPKPAMANTKNHCETSARKPERIIGIKPLLFTIKHKAKPRANQGKALGPEKKLLQRVILLGLVLLSPLS
jgi:hypothetical protein